jgi:hypothetical protein
LVAEKPYWLTLEISYVCEASKGRKRKKGQRSVERRQAAANNNVKSRISIGEATIRGSQRLSRNGAGAIDLGGDSTGGQGRFVTTAPAVLSPLVGGRPTVYEKKMRGHLAFARTLAHLPLWPSFFVRAALWLLVVAAFGVLSNIAAADAPASQPTWAIEVVGQSLCAGDPEFEERLWGQIPERQRAPMASAELRARVAVAKDQTASVSVYDQETRREAGQRRITLSQPGCRAAGEALALVVSVMVEAGRVPLAPEPEAPPQAPPPPGPNPPPAPAAPPAAPPPPANYVRPERHAWQGPPAGHDLVARAGTNYGLLPGWGIGVSAGWGVRGQRIWPIWISGTGWFNERSSDGRGRIGAGYGTLSTCPLHWGNARVRLRLCPGIAAGAMWSEGRRLPQRKRNVNLLTMGALEGAVHIRIVGPLELIFDVRMEVPVVRLNFVYERKDVGPTKVHMTRPVTGSFFGGLGLRFR